ncbi:MAG: hypothetical protein VX265_07345 [Myxococcota bacterium]|nr:hypothetical protein [Myxococcota bacterium]
MVKLDALPSSAPSDPAARARYVAALKAAYARGELRSRLSPSDIDDRVVRVVLPHLYPAVVAEA